MTQELDLTTVLQSHSFREIASALDEAMQSRTDMQRIDDYDQLLQFVACPLCRCKSDNTSIDVNHRLFVQLVLDAFKRKADSVVVLCNELEVTITYQTTLEGDYSESLPLRCWHQILSGLHNCFAKHRVSSETPAHDSNLDCLVISVIPDFDSLRKLAKKRDRTVPDRLRVRCTERQVTMRFE